MTNHEESSNEVGYSGSMLVEGLRTFWFHEFLCLQPFKTALNHTSDMLVSGLQVVQAPDRLPYFDSGNESDSALGPSNTVERDHHDLGRSFHCPAI